jgi:dissimilatory sulfite reductase (desulfoviridin) alpha/beta subunit
MIKKFLYFTTFSNIKKKKNKSNEHTKQKQKKDAHVRKRQLRAFTHRAVLSGSGYIHWTGGKLSFIRLISLFKASQVIKQTKID